MNDQSEGLSGIGKLITFVLILGLLGLGAWVLVKKDAGVPGKEPSAPTTLAPRSDPASAAPTPGPTGGAAQARVPANLEVQPPQLEVPRFPPPIPYTPKDNTLDIEISEYAGYAGLIVANGGLAPSEQSIFFKKHGFKVRLTVSENDDWSTFGNGKLAASATTADVLAVYGRQFPALVPLQLGFSRGADGVVVRSEIRQINQLKGKVLATRQFTEVDFLLRFLAQEAGLEIHMLPEPKAAPEPEKLNLVYCEDAEKAVQLFQRDLKEGWNLLAGCAGWAPFTTECIEQSGGKARLLIDNRNLLIVADLLVVHKQFAEQNPKLVAGLVDGALEGNRLVRENPGAHAETIAAAFKWQKPEVPAELAKVHLANLPENLAFFSGAFNAAGSFGMIFQSAVMAYGPELIKNPASPEKFLDLKHLEALKAAGAYADQQILIQPIKTQDGEALEKDPILSKDIRFYFEPNSARLDLTSKDRQENENNLASIRKLLQVSPGSSVLLRGHVDDAMKKKFQEGGGAELVRKKALEAVQLSVERAAEIRKHLIERHAVEAKRIDTFGAGWNEPTSKTNSDLNRRVEVRWFTLE